MGESRGTAAILLAGLAMVMAAGAFSVDLPLARDQGVALLGARIIADGGAPYRDLFYFNLPGNFFVYRLPLFFPDRLAAAVSWMDILFLTGTGLALFAAGRLAFSSRIGALAAFLYWSFALAYGHSYWNQAQKETLASLPLGLALWALAALDRSVRQGSGSRSGAALRALLFGGAIGLAFQFKPTLMVVLPTVLFAARSARGSRLDLLLYSGAAAVAGFAAAQLPLLWFLWSRDALASAWEGIVAFGGHYGSIRASAARSAASVSLLLVFSSFLIFTSVPAAVRSNRDPAAGTLVAFISLLALQVILQMKFFHYHFFPLLAPVCLLSAHSVDRLLDGAGSSRWRQPALAALLLFNLAPGWIANYYLPARGLTHYREQGGGIDQQASRAVAEYLREHSSPSDPVVVFGLEPGLYVQADRLPPTRFAYDLPLVAEADAPPFSARRQAWREEFIEDLILRPPLYIVINQNDRNPTEPQDSLSQVRGFEDFQGLLDRSYHLETRLGYYNIFVRNSAGLASGRKGAGGRSR